MKQDDFDFLYNINYSVNFNLKNLIENVIFSGMDAMYQNNMLNSTEQMEMIKFFNYIRNLQPALPELTEIHIDCIKSIVC